MEYTVQTTLQSIWFASSQLKAEWLSLYDRNLHKLQFSKKRNSKFYQFSSEKSERVETIIDEKLSKLSV